MLCNVEARSLKALIFALVALAACITPAASQIHWNRGWGAGGSMGKRSSPMSTGAASPSSSVDGILLPKSDCSMADLVHLTTLLARMVESEISRLAACEVREQLSSSEQDHLSRLPWWTQTRKENSPDL